MAMFPAAPPAGFPEMRPGPTSGFFVRQERAFFAQAGREIVRVREIGVREIDRVLRYHREPDGLLLQITLDRSERGRGASSWCRLTSRAHLFSGRPGSRVRPGSSLSARIMPAFES